MPASSVITINDGTKVVFDSLPYIDQIHQDYEDYAMALIEREMQKQSVDAAHPRVKKSGVAKHRTDILENEYRTLVRNGEFRARNHLKLVDQLAKGTAPGMEQTDCGDGKDDRRMDVDGGNDDDADDAEVQNMLRQVRHARSRYEAERLRGLTLEAEKTESTKHWKACVDGWMKVVQIGQDAMLKQQRDTVDEINFQREQLQTQSFAPQFQELEQEYAESVQRRNEYELALAG